MSHILHKDGFTNEAIHVYVTHDCKSDSHPQPPSSASQTPPPCFLAWLSENLNPRSPRVRLFFHVLMLGWMSISVLSFCKMNFPSRLTCLVK